MAGTQSAEPSTATTGIENLSPDERQKWRMTGELPERKEEEPPKPSNEESAPSLEEQKEAPPSEPAEGRAEAAPDSEPDATQGKPDRKLTPAEKRIKRLLAQRRADERRIQELEGKIAASTRSATEPPPAENKEEAKAERARPTPQDKKPDGSLKYSTYEEFAEDLADWKVEQRLGQAFAERDKAAKEQAAKTQQEQQQAAITNDWVGKVGKAREKYADFDTVALNEDLPVKSGSVVDVRILTSPTGTDLLYYLGQHPEELEKINALPPMDAAFELFKIESTLSGTPGPRKVTQAPPPAREVGGRGSAPTDSVASAVSNGDFASYRSAMNRKEIALRKG